MERMVNQVKELRYEIKETNKILSRIAKALEKWNEPLIATQELISCEGDCTCGTN